MISVVVLTKNEEKNLDRCLQSVSFAEEIVIVDDLSEDATVEIATKHKAHVFQNNMNNDFAQQRNFGIQKATGDWILFIDADEEVTPELKEEILKKIKSTDKKTFEDHKNNSHAFRIKRRDFFWGKELIYGEVAKVRNQGLVRLVKKGFGKWEGKVHEEFVANGEVSTLTHFLNHYPHQTVKEFIHHINIYSSLRAQELKMQGKKSSQFELIMFPFGKFIWTYFFRLGFLDGAAGFVYAFFMSFHSFLVRSKLYQYTLSENSK